MSLGSSPLMSGSLATTNAAAAQSSNRGGSPASRDNTSAPVPASQRDDRPMSSEVCEQLSICRSDFPQHKRCESRGDETAVGLERLSAGHGLYNSNDPTESNLPSRNDTELRSSDAGDSERRCELVPSLFIPNGSADRTAGDEDPLILRVVARSSFQHRATLRPVFTTLAAKARLRRSLREARAGSAEATGSKHAVGPKERTGPSAGQSCVDSLYASSRD